MTQQYNTIYWRGGPWIGWLALLLLVLGERLFVLIHFGFTFTDSDQTVMWHAAYEMLHGRFHEPFFYGQPYNPMLEALLAVPLLAARLPVHIALPVVTTALTLMPYAVISAVLLRQQKVAAAYIAVAIPLLLNPEFALVTTISRGFVTGVAMAAPLAVFAAAQLRISPIWFFVLSFCATCSFFINPNAGIVIIPAIIYCFLPSWKRPNAWMWGSLGTIPPLLAYQLAQIFYSRNPDYVLHPPLDYEFHWSNILLGIRHIDWYLEKITPVFWHASWLPLAAMIVALLFVCLYKRHWRECIAITLFVAILGLSFGLNKVHDGSESAFFSLTRMFIGVPVILAMFSAWVPWPKRTWFQVATLLFSMIFLIFKVPHLNATITWQTSLERKHIVFVHDISGLRRLCENIAYLASENHVETLIIEQYWSELTVAYGCPAMVRGFPLTLFPRYDRRTWRLHEAHDHRSTAILFLGSHLDKWGQYSNEESLMKLSNDPPLYLLKNMGKTDMEWVRRFAIPIRYYNDNREDHVRNEG